MCLFPVAAEALILDYNGDVTSGNGKARKGGCVSADSILDEHHVSFTGSLEEDSLKQLATSCPQLEHRQPPPPRSDTPHTRTRPPQIGTTRYTIVNTSTGSSTSGAVDLDISSGSNKSEPHGVFHGHKKSVLIVETTCTPDTPSSPEDPSDPLNRYRTSSFKRAIERGASGDSSQQSFETADPPSTSPDLTPEHGDLPPYPPPPPTKNFPDNTLYPYDRYSRHPEQSSGDFLSPKLCDVSPDLSWVEQPSRDYTTGEDHRYRTSTPDTSLDTETEPTEKTPLVDAKWVQQGNEVGGWAGGGMRISGVYWLTHLGLAIISCSVPELQEKYRDINCIYASLGKWKLFSWHIYDTRPRWVNEGFG